MSHHLLRKFPSIMKCPRCVTSTWYLSCTPSNLFLSSLYSIFNFQVVPHHDQDTLCGYSCLRCNHCIQFLIFKWYPIMIRTFSMDIFSLHLSSTLMYLLQYLCTLNTGSWTSYTFILLLRKAPRNRWRSKLTFFSLKLHFFSPLDDSYLVIKTN